MKILKILRKLNEHLPVLVGKCFFANNKLPNALLLYIESTKFEDLAGDSFILLINVFDQLKPENVSTQFLNKLESALEFIEDENTLHSLVSILVCLLPYFEEISPDPSDISKNPILLEFVKKEVFYREKLIYITNRGTQYRLDKCAMTLNIMLSKPDLASYYFNINDINLILDILLREVATNTQGKTRVELYKLMETVLDSEIYREYKYRQEDVEQIIQELIIYEDEDTEKRYDQNELECIATLNQFF